jgi:cytochrome c5
LPKHPICNHEDNDMNFKPVMIAVAVAALAACSDTDEPGGEPGETSMMEKASEMSGELASSIREKAAATGQSVSQAADKAGQAVSESVRAVGKTGTEWVASAMDATRTPAESASGTTTATAETHSGDAAGQQPISTAESDAALATGAAAGFAAVEPVATQLLADPARIAAGEKIYAQKCMACHATGAAGAPKLGDSDTWQARIDQGEATLFEHAIEGFQGKQGYMPAKGGFSDLSDDEVKAAVAYMVSQSQ